MDTKQNIPQMQPQSLQVILLAGGKGQKLFPLTDRNLKSLLPIANKPMIAYQLEYLERCGFNEVLVVTRHSKTLEKYLKTDYKGKIMIETIELNEESTNNVEALKQISNKINRDFIVIPCDLICDISLDDVVDQHIITQATVTMVFREEEKKATNTKKEASKEVKEENNDYDVVVVDQESNRVLQIMNNTDVENEGLKLKKILLAKHPHSTISTNLFDCHLYIFNYKVLEFLKKCKRKFWNIKDDFLPFLIENQYNIKLSKEFFEETPRNEDFLYMNSKLKGEEKKTQFVSVYGFISQNNYCKRTNIIKEYMQANLDFFLKPPNLPDCLISSRNNEPEIKEKKFADTMIGEGTVIGEKTIISRSVIGKNCVIGTNVKITKSVIMNNVTIENDCIVQDSIICSKAVIKEKGKVKDDAIAHNEIV